MALNGSERIYSGPEITDDIIDICTTQMWLDRMGFKEVSPNTLPAILRRFKYSLLRVPINKLKIEDLDDCEEPERLRTLEDKTPPYRDYQYDRTSHVLFPPRDIPPIQTTPTEGRILDILITNAERLIPRDRLVEFAFRCDPDDLNASNLKTHISHLRRKLEMADDLGDEALDIRVAPWTGYVIATRGRFPELRNFGTRISR